VQALREWWVALAPRERAIIAVSVCVLALAILWAYVWQPISAERTRLIAAMPRLRAQADQVAQQGAEVDQLRSAVRARGPGSPPQSAVEQTMKAGGLASAFAGVSTLGEGRVQVSLRPVAFDDLVDALTELAEKHGLAVDSIALKAAGEPGKVQVDNLVLRGARSG